MSSIATDLAHLLEGILRSGDYFTSGDCEILPPGLEVEGVGPIALPLLPGQARELIAAADRAPYGRGGQTLVDTQVRRTWQIDADRVRFRGRRWSESLAGIVALVTEGLGVTDPVEAELYKLLVYDEGAFFVGHRDTEKTPGMFATLVIVLPSQYTGGELVVRHRDRETRIDLRRTDPGDVAFAAFYADCPHEILPVTSGAKLTLVYNLRRASAGAAPKPPSYGAEEDDLTRRLRQWARDERDEELSPDKVIYPLEHAYTEESLSFETLKGADAARAATLTAAARAADCDLHLALLCIEESGSAEYLGDYRSYRRRRYQDDFDGDGEGDFEISEVFERTETLSSWRRPDGGDPGLGDLPVDASEVSPPDALEDMVPDAQSFQEAAGNEGASFERSYRKAALVLWPVDRRLAVINQGGLAATLPFLAALADQWAKSKQDQTSPLWREAHELAGHMLVTWPRGGWRPEETSREAAAALTALIRLGDTERVDRFLAEVTAAGVFAKADNHIILTALRLLSKARAAELIQAIVAGGGRADLGACASLLAKAAALEGRDSLAESLAPAARALLHALPGDPAIAPLGSPWRRPRAMEPEVAVDTLFALDRIEPNLAAAAVDRILAWPTTYDSDAVIVPAVLVLRGADPPLTASATRLVAAGRDHLRARISLPLAPPDTWTRSGQVGCACAHCAALSRFLADPDQPIWHFKAIQADRSHVESVIRNSNCDLDVTTLRKGSPHVLVCVKNQASYERRARQRERDLEVLAKIEQAAEPPSG